MKCQNFNLNLPSNYEITELEDGIINISDEINGVGAITITKYIIPDSYEFIIAEELNDFLASIEDFTEDIKHEVTIESATRISTEFFSLENRFWKLWLFYEYRTAMFITYNCESKKSKDKELSVIEKIVSSISIDPL